MKLIMTDVIVENAIIKPVVRSKKLT